MPDSKRRKKFFTISQANAMLPLLRAILRDVTELAHDLNDRRERLQRLQPAHGSVGDASREELEQQVAEFERDRDRLNEFVVELQNLGVELKDPFAGLIDFPCLLDNHEVYLCWRMDEPDVAHWHELDSGFAGRQKLMVDSAN
jgi:hypothetical protein